MTIITEFGKLRYNRLPIRMCASCDIFQAKVDKLIGYIELKFMVSAETLLSYPYWKIPFTVHTDASEKQLCAVISQNNKLFPYYQ